MPESWRGFIERNVPFVARLSEQDRLHLFGCVQVFLAEKRFEGCAGIEITDEIRVTIAAQACVLLLHRFVDDCYPNLSTILVYPTTFLVHSERKDAAGVVDESPQARLGESWSHDIVVLAWDSVLAGAADIHDGHNVVLHEFAHQLDQEGGGAGSPVLPRRSMYVAWARVLAHEYDELVRDTALRHRTVLDKYGAKSPAEFFAVATESFFEKPHQLRRKHPELYLQLQEFYGQDPASLGGPP